MKAVVVFIFLLGCYLSPVFSQEKIEKLDSLHQELEELKSHLEGKQRVTISRALLDLLIKERDSLEMSNELLKSENLLLNAKYSAEKRKNRSQEKLVEKETASEVKTVSEDAISGYYIVLESERDKSAAELKVQHFKKKYPTFNLIIVQNHIKTWYHICLATPYDLDNIGVNVQTIRDKGIHEAWWIHFK